MKPVWERLWAPSRAHKLWLGKWSVLVAWAGLLAGILLPPHGAGVALCWIQPATGLPCLGCGMTRSLSCALRGMFAESWSYHPFGFFVLALFVFTAGQSLLSSANRARLAQFMESRARLFTGLYAGFVVSFVAFGVVRAVAHCLNS